ncbi:MAG: AAA family ATPase [Candidatus Micrarchaeia archaeon]
MKPYIIRVSSQKGGVGKTTIAVNLAVALQLKGYNVLLVDMDTVNPSIGFHLGFERVNIGLKELVTNKAKLIDVRVVHLPSGLHVVPGVLSEKEYILSESMIKTFYNIIIHSNYHFVIVDTMPGYTTDNLDKYYDEALLVSTPELSSVANVVRLATWFDKAHLKHNLVLNKIKNKRYELSIKEIEEVYENKIIAKIPEDDTVPVSIEMHTPTYLYNKRTPFSKNIEELARFYESKSEIRREEAKKSGILDAILKIFKPKEKNLKSSSRKRGY